MLQNPSDKYQPFAPIALTARQWPDRQISKAPIWCSVDLRDGNQALIEPMGLDKKLRMFRALLEMGFKEIEVGFPSASQTDFDFLRHIIDNGLIPEDVTIQVLVQCRDHLIERTFEGLQGCKKAIVHFYNSTSQLQRRVVFELDKQGIIDIAVTGAKLIKKLADKQSGTDIRFEYSPESFTGTELPFAKAICEAVMDVIAPTPQRKIILNLPATVEMSSPNLYADMIEWFDQNVDRRDSFILSLHPHNDRGTGVAAAELGLLAGADRIEGTLFGNGERCGNVDIITLCLNMYTQGLNPELSITDINSLVKTVEFCNQLPVHPRHPYAGDLVYTSFSGSHQDAIKKGFAAMAKSNSQQWEVPYIPMDPKDVGRDYEAVVRVNSQSGKGGIAWLMEQDHGIKIPRRMLIEFSQLVQQVTDTDAREIGSAEIHALFVDTYLNRTSPLHLVSYEIAQISHASELFKLSVIMNVNGKSLTASGHGNGPIDAFVLALNSILPSPIHVQDYREHALHSGENAMAISYIDMKTADDKIIHGAGAHENIITASLNAIVSAVNRGGLV